MCIKAQESMVPSLPSKFNVRKTLWRSTNLDTDEAHVRNIPNMGRHSIYVFASPLGSSLYEGPKACLVGESCRILSLVTIYFLVSSFDHAQLSSL